MSHITDIEIHQYLPRGVQKIIAEGGSCWIGKVDETTVLKYPYQEMRCVQIEARLLGVLGCHPLIVKSKGMTKDGLLLEFYPIGNLHDYLLHDSKTPLERRLVWCMQAAEAVAYIHSKRILHCDIRHDNFLLDADFNLRLADFQGQHFSENGKILLDGLSVESTKAYLPRNPADHASIRTDLFALGTLIYFIMMGHELFPELDSSRDEGEIERRFSAGEFPNDPHICATITGKCWRQVYLSARQVVADLEAVRNAFARGETLDYITRYVVSVPNENASTSVTSWLSGLCDEGQTSKKPPAYRQLMGCD